MYGQIVVVGFPYAPPGHAFCDGALLPIAQNRALYDLLGTTYGGDGVTTFALPDMRGRTGVGMGAGPGVDPVQLGEADGVNANTLTEEQVPAHGHRLAATSAVGEADSPVGAVPASAHDANRNPLGLYSAGVPDMEMQAEAVGETGDGQPVTNMQPYVGLYWCIDMSHYSQVLPES
jgi:microcystin-dependent protein